jgi:hypothetical protein
MWHRLDRILGRWDTSAAATAARCEACGGRLWPGPALVIEAPSGECRRVCSPECLPAIWKKVEVGRQKVSRECSSLPQRNVSGSSLARERH